MREKLSKRTVPKSTEKEPKEPEGTSLGVEPEVVPVKRERMLCSESCIHEVYRHGLCHHHYKVSQGFVFDEANKLYVKKKGK
jgi:hypothetical protein